MEPLTVIEALRAAFGPNAEQRIDLSSAAPYLGWEVRGVELCTATEDRDIRGRVFVKCGHGDAIAVLRPVGRATSIVFFLTYDDDAGRRWDCVRARNDWSEPKGNDPADDAGRGPRPCARLCLVVSA